MTRTTALLVVSLVASLAGCASDTEPIPADAPEQSAPQFAKFDTWTRSGGNRFVIHGPADDTKLEVYSDRGIGNGVVTLTEGAWPTAMTVKLHTRLLERFEVETSDGKKAGISVQSYGDHTTLQDPPQKPADPLYMPVTIVDFRLPPAKPLLPIRDPEGHFAITLPPALFAGKPQWIKLSWIDVYRN